MLCAGPPDGGHHGAYDRGVGANRLEIVELTPAGAEGPLEFRRGETVYREVL